MTFYCVAFFAHNAHFKTLSKAALAAHLSGFVIFKNFVKLSTFRRQLETNLLKQAPNTYEHLSACSIPSTIYFLPSKCLGATLMSYPNSCLPAEYFKGST